jgi:hypothetical protein
VKSHRFPLEVLFPKVRAEVFELLFGATLREHYVRELLCGAISPFTPSRMSYEN